MRFHLEHAGDTLERLEHSTIVTPTMICRRAAIAPGAEATTEDIRDIARACSLEQLLAEAFQKWLLNFVDETKFGRWVCQ